MKLTQGQVKAIAAGVGMKDPARMAAIAMAESGGDTLIVNSIGCVGLWQINQPVWVKSHPTWTRKWLQNPINNAIAAKAVYAVQGFGAWQAYTGPDAKGSDGPWRKFENAPATVPAGFNWRDPFNLAPDGSELEKSPRDWMLEHGFGTESPMDSVTPDWMSSAGSAIKATADWVSNPRNWLRVAYGVAGGALVIGGLLLMVRNTALEQVVSKAGGIVKNIGKGK